ncbi:atherin-like [Zalophus californianus]|uniref:Atherin-like n=1 Tax=Zalophus californianus TaxID=9704 RepID=A0A6J2C1Y4_ZALCA|nr:atherin-like [Zalophus californianus]
MALGPAAPAHSVPGTFSPRLAAAAAATGRRVRAGEHALRGHARGGRTGRGARGSTRAGWLPRSRGHAATAAPTGGSRSRPKPGPARARRAVPRRCRSALTLAQARAPPATLAPRHPAPHGRPPPLREPSLCRQPDKAPARGPLHHLPETGAFVTCRWHPPQHTHTCPHTHTSPHPQAGPGANPHCCWDPHRHTLKVITVLHHRVTWRVPNRHGAWGGGGSEGLGRSPRQAGCGVGRRGLGLRAGAVPLPPPPSRAPCPARRAREPTGLRLRPDWSCAAPFPSRPAVARCLKLCVSGPRRAGSPSLHLLPLSGRFPGRAAQGALVWAEKGLPAGVRCGEEFPASPLRVPGLGCER